MKNENTKLKLISSGLIFIFLLIIKNYLFVILNINISDLSNTCNTIFNALYVFTSLLISIIFYICLNQKKDLKRFLCKFGKGIGVIFAYFILNELLTLPFLLAGINYENIPLTIKIIYAIVYEIMMIGIIIIILKDEIKKALNDIKKNHMTYFSKYIKYWFIALIIMFASNLVITFISKGGMAGNEETIRTMFSQTPVYIFISSVFFAPLLEELVFRQGIRNIFSNNILFIIVSGLVFGGLHVVGNINAWYDILYLIPYSTPGFVFAYILTKTDNIFVPMGLHFLHNGIMMSLQILLIVLGQI